MISVEDLQDLAGFKFLNLKDIKIAYSALCQNKTFKYMWFSSTTLLFIENGQTEIIDEHQTYQLNAGDSAVIQPFSKISLKKTLDNKTDKAYSSFVFTLLPDFLHSFLAQLDLQNSKVEEENRHVVTIKKNTAIDNFFYSLHPFLEKKEKLNEDILKSKTFECLKKISLLEPSFISFLQQKRNPIKVSLNEFMLNTFLGNYTIPQLAQISGRSLSSFKREFNDTFNDTPHQWILKQKMDLAEKVLKNSSFNAIMVYQLLGFKELSHFSSTFRKIKGYNVSEIKYTIT